MADIVGTDGYDFLYGTKGNDAISGLAGDDVIYASSGNDVIDGGADRDSIFVTPADGSLFNLPELPDTYYITNDSITDTNGLLNTSFNSIEFIGFATWNPVGITIDASAWDPAPSVYTSLGAFLGDGNNVVIGSSGWDLVYSGVGSDILDGRDGNDEFHAGGGNDQLIGGAGNDILDGGDGQDLANYGPSTGPVIVNLALGMATGDGNDTLISIEDVLGSTYDDTLTGDDNYNVLNGGGGNNILHGASGDDTLIGGHGNNQLFGDDGNDQLISGTGDELLDGGNGRDVADYLWAGGSVAVDLSAGTASGTDGNDTLVSIEDIRGSNYADTLTGDGGDNYIVGGGGDDTIDGAGGDDYVVGDDGNDQLFGGDGFDVLRGGLGDDHLDGGDGNDLADYAGAAGPVVVDLGAGTSSGADGNDTLVSIEWAAGSAFDDQLTGNGGYNYLAGGDGNDTIHGAGGDDSDFGGDGNDHLYGDDGNDQLVGQAGDDYLDGGAGQDVADYQYANGPVSVNLAAGTASGADGNDTLVNIEDIKGSAFDDQISGNGGDNFIDAFDGNDVVNAGGGNDYVVGGLGNDVLNGQAGYDSLDGGDGNDVLNGGANNDQLFGGAGNDFMVGGPGDDTLDGGDGFDRIGYFAGTTTGVTVDLRVHGPQYVGELGWDTISNVEAVSGTIYADTLTGDDNSNWLWGSVGGGANNNDTLDGQGGDDLLEVGAGNHSITGGSGTDTLQYSENGGPEVGIVVDLNLQGGAQNTNAGSWTLNGIENVSSGDGDDVLTGDFENNVLAGAAGSDTLTGGGGNDTLYGDGSIVIDFAGAGAISYDPENSRSITGAADGNDVLDGGAGDDTLYGGGGNDVLTGGAGNDLNYGGSGDDLIRGRAGDDLIDGGDGYDRAGYYTTDEAAGGVTVDLNLQGQAQNTGQGWDTLVSIEYVSGTPFADVLTGDGNDNILWGSSATIDPDSNWVSTTNNDTLDGGGGNDLLAVGIGNQTLIGGDGIDTVAFTENFGDDPAIHIDLNLQGVAQDTGQGIWTLTGIENLSGGDDNDTLIGDDNQNILAGATGDDFLSGGGGNDALYGDGIFDSASPASGAPTLFTDFGANGNDTLDGGAGDDQLYGGGGNDTASFASETSGVQAFLYDGGFGEAFADDGYDQLHDIENLTGSAFSDQLFGNNLDNVLSGGDGDDGLYGGAGNDQLDGGNGYDFVSYGNAAGSVEADLSAGTSSGADGNDIFVSIEGLVGSQYDDVLIGDDNSNGLTGLGGNDILLGGAGYDTLVGSEGDDTLDGGDDWDVALYAYAQGAVTVDLAAGTASGEGNDTLVSIEAVTGSSFNDVLLGDDNANDLNGGDGDDTLEGRAGDDQLIGGAGMDTASYEHAAGAVQVVLYANGGGAGESTGADGADLLSGIENLTGSAFNDQLIGNNLDNVLSGGDGVDLLRGKAGNDTLQGGAGDDYLDGGVGDDVLDGGDGWDRLSYFGSATGPVTIDLRIQGVAQNTGQGYDTLIGIEHVGGTIYGDTLIGNDGQNVIRGASDGLGSPVDHLYGQGGDDLISDGAGDHVMDGGDGVDTFLYEAAAVATGIHVSLAAQGAAQDTGVGNMTLTNFENLDGTVYADALTGDGNANVLAGDLGDDTLSGGAGNDSLYGDGLVYMDTQGTGLSGPIGFLADSSSLYVGGVGGNDTLEGGLGNDLINGGSGSDTASYAHASGSVTVDLAAGTATGADGNDTLTSIECVVGSNFGDSIFGDSGVNRLDGGNGNDRLISGDGNDLLYGGNGNDILKGELGDDLIDGGAGTDMAKYYQSDAALGGVTVSLLLQGSAQYVGSLGWDTLISIENIYGTPFADTITGDDGDNWLSGSEATIAGIGVSTTNNDVIDGRGGNDVVSVGLGNHMLTGGSGIDTVAFSEGGFPEVGITIDLNLQGGAQATGAGSWTLSGFENVGGGQLDDMLTGDGGANILAGNAGNDTLVGGAGDDVLYGDGTIDLNTNRVITTFADVGVTFGWADGNDTLEGGLGNDTLNGGGGTDTASYEHASGAVTVTLFNNTTGNGNSSGADGSDTLNSIENLKGSAYNDVLTGNALANVLTGGDGHDSLRGNGGDDTLYGGLGDDFVNGGQGNDYIDGGAGYDRAAYFTNATNGVHVDLNLQGVAQDTLQGIDTLVNIENVTGTAFGDTLIGDGGNNWLGGQTDALGTVDTISGGGGNDLIVDGAGDHVLDGGAGTDTFSFNGNAPGGVIISLASQGAAQNTGAGNMTLSGFENLSGSAFNDTLTGDGGNNVLGGEQGDDVLVGGAGDDALYGDGYFNVDTHGTGGSGTINFTADVATNGGADGNDLLEGGLGNDTINGGGGNDTASYANASGSVTVNLATGTASGSDGNDTLVNIENITGGAFNDTLTGNSGINSITGGAGNDTILGGAGVDTIDGGTGVDTASYTNATGAVTVTLTATGGSSSGADGNDTLVSIENIVGGAFNDTLTGNAGINSIAGGAGNDTIQGSAGNDTIDGGVGVDTATYVNATGAVTVTLTATGGSSSGADGTDTLISIENATGSAFNDTLIGNASVNVLSGLDGNDLLNGGVGADTLDGGNGTDTATYANGTGGVTVNLATGAASGADGNDTLANVENMVGSAFNDTLTGSAGNNTIDGGAGADTIQGGAGDDLLIGGDGADNLDGGAGINTADYSSSSAAVTVNLNSGRGSGGAAQGDSLANIANLAGSAFNDKLTGSGSANLLSGGAGNDQITGGGGADVLYGGTGADSFLFLTSAEIGTTASHDAIWDFEAGGTTAASALDHIDLSAIDAIARTTTRDDPFTFIGTGAFTNRAGELRVQVTGDHVANILGDTNGDGVADFVLEVHYTGTLDATDFVL